jgi:hypothetical protein
MMSRPKAQINWAPDRYGPHGDADAMTHKTSMREVSTNGSARQCLTCDGRSWQQVPAKSERMVLSCYVVMG